MHPGLASVLFPTDRQPSNLVTFSKQFSSWTLLNSTVQDDAVAAPDGTITADRLKGNANNGNHRATSATITYQRGASVISVFGQADQRSIAIGFVSGASFVTTGFDLTGDGAVQWANNSIGTRFTNPVAYVQKWNGGWYRCEVSFLLNGGTTGTMFIGLQNGSTDAFVSATTEGAYIWGAQFEPGLRAGPFIAT